MALRVPALAGLVPDRLASAPGAFRRWWFGELRAIVPAPLVRAFRARADIVLFDVGERSVLARRIRGQGEVDVGRIVLDKTDAASRRAQFNVFADQLDGRAATVIVRLSPDRVLRKVLDLPAAARENLAEILTFEMDRTTPFTSEEVYFTYRVLEVERQTRRVRVELLILPKASADPAIELVRGWGLNVERLEVQTDGPRTEAPAHDTVDFLPAAADAPSRRPRRPLVLALAASTAALMIAAVYLPLHQQQRVLETLDAEVALAKRKADAGRRLREDMAQSVSQSNFIIERKLRRPAFVDVLDELTTLVPDKTWLIRIRYYNGEVQAFGNSPTASALVGLLEESPLFTNTQFRAPVTRDPRLGVERFHIGSQVADRIASRLADREEP